MKTTAPGCARVSNTACVATVLLGVLLQACVETRAVELEKGLGKPEAPPAAVVKGARVAVLEHRPFQPGVTPGSPGDAPQPQPLKLPPGAAPPLPKQKRVPSMVEYTSLYRETYQSFALLMETVPAALGEAGFQVVNALSFDEAMKLGADLVVELHPPEIEGFRRASGGGVSLEGTVYDANVTARATLRRADGSVLGAASGHGRSVTNFRFEDPYLEVAVVGAISLLVAAGSTLLIGAPLMAVLLYRAHELKAREPGPYVCERALDVARESRDLEAVGSRSLCERATWVAAQVAVMTVLAANAGTVLVLSRFVAARVFGGVTGFIKGRLADGIWRDMLKSAHDRAARSLAEKVALRWQMANAGPAPAPTEAPAGAPSTAGGTP